MSFHDNSSCVSVHFPHFQESPESSILEYDISRIFLGELHSVNFGLNETVLFRSRSNTCAKIQIMFSFHSFVFLNELRSWPRKSELDEPQNLCTAVYCRLSLAKMPGDMLIISSILHDHVCRIQDHVYICCVCETPPLKMMQPSGQQTHVTKMAQRVVNF